MVKILFFFLIRVHSSYRGVSLWFRYIHIMYFD
jgi:hypothetical protein